MTRYSQIYLRPDEPINDSQRFRKRLSTLISILINEESYNDLQKRIELETGTNAFQSRNSVVYLANFPNHAELRDILDSITIIFNYLKTHHKSIAYNWKVQVTKIFEEENLEFTLDDECIVHVKHDKIFRAEQAETLTHLNSEKYNAVRYEFEKACHKLSEAEPNTKDAVRDIFESLEILSKLIDPRISRLGSTEIQRNLLPKIQNILQDETAKDASRRMAESFAEWTNAAHLYRHGQGVHEPTSPPLGLAILMVSNGMAYLRWLLEIDAGSKA